MNKYLVGSGLLGLNNRKDKDFVVIVDSEDENYYERRLIDGEDICFRSKSNVDRQMNFELPLSMETARYYIINYQLDKDIVGQNFPYEYHILDRRNDYIELLNYIVDNECFAFNRRVIYNHGFLSKLMYHIAYLTFIMKNNSPFLSKEQKEIVQKIHDKKMPDDYADELKAMIKELRAPEGKEPHEVKS